MYTTYDVFGRYSECACPKVCLATMGFEPTEPKELDSVLKYHQLEPT